MYKIWHTQDEDDEGVGTGRSRRYGALRVNGKWVFGTENGERVRTSLGVYVWVGEYGGRAEREGWVPLVNEH